MDLKEVFVVVVVFHSKHDGRIADIDDPVDSDVLRWTKREGQFDRFKASSPFKVVD